MTLFLAAALLCWPPTLPPLDSLDRVASRVVVLPGLTDKEHFMAQERRYRDQTGKAWGVVVLMQAPVLIDDEPDEPDGTAWLLDPQVLTDDVPPRVQAEPRPSCQWRRRSNA